MRPRPRRAGRLALCALLAGLGWYALVPWLETADFPYAGGGGPQVALCFELSVLVPAWFSRRFLASMPWAATLPAAVLGLLLGALCFGVVEVASTYLTGSTIDEIEESPSLSGKLEMTVFCALWVALSMSAAAARKAYLWLPLSWLTLLLLRWASGGLENRERPEIRHAQS